MSALNCHSYFQKHEVPSSGILYYYSHELLDSIGTSTGTSNYKYDLASRHFIGYSRVFADKLLEYGLVIFRSALYQCHGTFDSLSLSIVSLSTYS